MAGNQLSTPAPRQLWTLVLASLGLFICALDTLIVSTALPVLGSCGIPFSGMFRPKFSVFDFVRYEAGSQPLGRTAVPRSNSEVRQNRTVARNPSATGRAGQAETHLLNGPNSCEFVRIRALTRLLLGQPHAVNLEARLIALLPRYLARTGSASGDIHSAFGYDISSRDYPPGSL